MNARKLFTGGIIVILALTSILPTMQAQADAVYQTLPFSQNWTDTTLLAVSDSWASVPGITGFRGDNLTAVNDVDARTVIADDTPGVPDVNANQMAPNAYTTGGVTEFHLTDPVVAMQGSSTADAPYLQIYLNTSGKTDITVAYDVRDMDGSIDNAAQQVALQYRVGTTGEFTNVAAAYIVDATSGPSLATLVTPVSVTLPAAANNQAQLQLRIMTTNATGNDEWVGIDNISITGTDLLVDTAPSVSGTTPTNGSIDIARNSNITINFNEAVDVTGNWFQIDCSSSGTINVADTAVTGGPTSFTIDPTTDFAFGETCTVTIASAQVTDQDANDPPDTLAVDYSFGFTVIEDVCSLPYTSIPSIQGSGATVALAGTRTTQGVVVGDHEGASPALRGFFIQDPVGDGDPATSDGIFVFESSNANTVSLGDIVRVTGTAGENQGQSQISVGTIVKCGTGTVTPTDVTFPVASTGFLERYEGMLVRLPQTMYVTEHFQLGRFGQVVLSVDGRLQQPTNVTTPGIAANTLQAANTLRKIILDDASQAQNPDPILFARGGLPLSASNTLRGGDTATGIVGVLNYTWAGNSASPNAYRIRPINALDGYVNFEAANARPASAPAVGGSLKVVGMNLLNFFNTIADNNAATPGCFPSGTDADCRGATTQTEFDRQWPKTVAAILALDADVIGFNEIENDGYDSTSAIAFLVEKLNAATAPGTYAFIDADDATSQVNALGVDAIKVGMIYKPASVTPIGQTAVLNTVAFINGGDSTPRNRASLLQAFEQNSSGAVFMVNINHLKSKGSACTAPDAGDGQGNCNVVRVNAVNELMAWFATDPTGTGDPDILMVGDYNSYAMEDPITVIKNSGFTNLISEFLGTDAYSYVFDGQWGYLDHALGSTSLTAQVTGVGDYHINSDEPSVLDYLEDFKSAGQLVSLYAANQFRVSDHDPVVVGLELDATLPETQITSTPSLFSNSATGSFVFSSTESGSTFQCNLDNGAFSTCSSAYDYLNLLEGEHTIEVYAVDAYGNADPSPSTYTWTVDLTAPVVTVPANISVVVSVKTGAVVKFSASATDAIDPANPVVSCDPPSGSLFAPGVTTVTCSATDSAGNKGSDTFTVSVISKVELLKNRWFESASSNFQPLNWSSNYFMSGLDRLVSSTFQGGKYSLNLVGNGKPKAILQNVAISGKAGDTFALSAWSKAKSIPTLGVYAVQVSFLSGTTVVGTTTASFANGIHDWQKISKTFTAPADFTSIRYMLIFRKASGSALFDSVSLLKIIQ